MVKARRPRPGKEEGPAGSRRHGKHIQRYLITGVLTVIPIWITWLVFDFVLGQLSKVGAPWVRALSRSVRGDWPVVADWLLQPWFQSALAIVLTLIGLYVLGWAATQVLGRRLLTLFDAVMERIPLVQTIYGATKKLLAALQQKPDQVQRVVLIEFPTEHMKTVGFVTRVLTDEVSGRKLAAVYVPTTPNPTSGYLEIVPIERVVSTDWTIDEAMTFIISGGAVAPDSLHYTNPTAAPPPSPASPADGVD
jgi:uncharacterized membrane protein